MAATNSAFRTETRDEHLYNHIELFNRSSSPIDAPAANRCQDCRERQPTENQIATGRRMFGDYRTEPCNEHLYYNIQSINKPSSPATESQGAKQTSQDDRRGQQPTGNSKTMGRRVTSAVLALAFLAMLASLLALKWELVKSCRTNGNQDFDVMEKQLLKEIKKVCADITKVNQTAQRGVFQFDQVVAKLDQVLNQTKERNVEGGLVLDGMQQQLTNVERKISLLADKNLVYEMTARIIHNVSSNQTEGRRLLETKIDNQSLELNQINCTGFQDGGILNYTRQKLNEVLENLLNDTVADFINKVTSNQNDVRRWLGTKIDNQTLVLKDSKDPWIKMTKSPIRFSLIDNQLGCCFIVPSSGTLAAVKLVHAYGYVACNDTHVTFWWGCGENNEDVKVKIREATGEDIHSETFSPEHTGSLRIPGYSPLSSELVLSYLSDPPKVIGRQKLCLSYSGATNAGKSFFDVYARFE